MTHPGREYENDYEDEDLEDEDLDELDESVEEVPEDDWDLTDEYEVEREVERKVEREATKKVVPRPPPLLEVYERTVFSRPVGGVDLKSQSDEDIRAYLRLPAQGAKPDSFDARDFQRRMEELHARFLELPWSEVQTGVEDLKIQETRKADTILAFLRREIARLELLQMEVNQQRDVVCNDALRYLSRRRSQPTVKDREEQRRLAAESAARLQEQQEQKQTQRERLLRRKRMARAAEDADKALTSSVQEIQDSAKVVKILEAMVQAGLATVEYKERAIRFAYSVDRVNTDLIAGKTR